MDSLKVEIEQVARQGMTNGKTPKPYFILDCYVTQTVRSQLRPITVEKADVVTGKPVLNSGLETNEKVRYLYINTYIYIYILLYMYR